MGHLNHTHYCFVFGMRNKVQFFLFAGNLNDHPVKPNKGYFVSALTSDGESMD